MMMLFAVNEITITFENEIPIELLAVASTALPPPSRNAKDVASDAVFGPKRITNFISMSTSMRSHAIEK